MIYIKPMENKLELRMYGFVPYNISEIQKGIQFGHALVEYGLENFNTTEYLDWAKYWKTFIILNGGTSNHSTNRYHETEEEYVGSMETILETLKENVKSSKEEKAEAKRLLKEEKAEAKR